MDSTTVWVVIVLFAIFILAVAFKFRNAKTFNQLPLEPGESVLLEDQPVRIWFQRNTNGSMQNKKTTILMRPIIKITNKRLIVGQRFFRKPDARIYTVFSLIPTADDEGMLSRAMQDGFATTDITLSSLVAKSKSDGTYIIDLLGTMHNLPIVGSITPPEIIRIQTTNISGYEQALGKKAEVSSK